MRCTDGSFWGLGVALLAACATPAGPASAPVSTADLLFVAPEGVDFDRNPKLLARVKGSAHGYFRFINQPFSEAVCRNVRRVLSRAPAVNLHGDAHVEQYAVTDLGRGLTDFDDATTGPAPIDLLRFGVSLSLAAHALGRPAETDRLLTRFLAGYRRALERPDIRVEEPALARRFRSTFKGDRSDYFAWIASISKLMPAAERNEIEVALEPYVANMRAETPGLRPGFFEIVDVRRLQIGIGSALDDKFLVRIDGETSAPTDDVILELKEVRDLSGVTCVSTPPVQDPFRILVGQSRIAYRPYKYLGYIRVGGRAFWIHGWVDNYRELKLDRTSLSVDDLAEVAVDVGVQLGRGHPNQIAAPLDLQLRRELLALLDQHEVRFRQAVRALTEEVIAAWGRFVSAADDPASAE